jgi:hypothetical protein
VAVAGREPQVLRKGEGEISDRLLRIIAQLQANWRGFDFTLRGWMPVGAWIAASNASRAR